MSQGKLPPQSVEVEQSLIGAILLNRDAISDVAEFLKPEHFYRKIHGDIFEAMLSLYEDREPIDIVTVSEELKKMKKLTAIGGKQYLADLVDMVPTAAHAEQYGKIIKDHHTKREIISLASELNELAFDERHDVQELMDTAESAIFRLSQQHLRKVFVPIKEALAESFDRLEELHRSSGSIRGVPSGFKDLDALLAGMHPSNLIILAARPGTGKTAFSLGIAQYVSVVEKKKVGFFSLEMSKEELVDRLLVSQADIDAWKLKTGRLGEEDFAKLSDAMGVLADAPLYIDDTPGMSIMEMRTKARRLMSEQGLNLIIVDYLQLIRGRGIENRVQEVAEISQGLKNLARELKVPVLSLSQLSRAVEHRGSNQPQLSDLRDSGAIEQDADVVMFLYREDPDLLESVNLGVAKHRNGPTGVINLYFKGDRIRFYDVDSYRSIGGAEAATAKK